MHFVVSRLLPFGFLLCLICSSLSPVHASTAEEKAPDSQGLPLNEIRTFVDIFDRIKKAYVEEVEDATLLNNAIKGMLSELDPHSAYLEPQAYSDLQISTSGEFGGLGIEVGMEEGLVKVITPIDDTPAQQAGILTGDIIIKIDQAPVKGLSLNEAVELMRGKPGTDIKLDVLRESSALPLEFTLTRAVIQVQSVKARIIEPGFGYIRLTQFQQHSGKDMIQKITALQTKEKTPLSGLVLDLRNNPGGVLQAAVEIADAFLEKGLLVYTQGRLPNSELRFNAQPGDVVNGLPIVVLINGGSASASEIVAGALQDHNRAIIMGTPSFGKGSVQTVLPLNNERALKLTTARYYTPSGRSIQATGITPDIQVENARLTPIKNTADSIHEADLKGHLQNTLSEVDEGTSSNSNQHNNHKSDALATKDYQLLQALSLLKGLKVVSNHQTATKSN